MCSLAQPTPHLTAPVVPQMICKNLVPIMVQHIAGPTRPHNQVRDTWQAPSPHLGPD